MNEAENHTNIVEVEFDTVMNMGVKDIDETEFFVEETQDFNEANIDYVENNNEQDDCGFVDENGHFQKYGKWILLEVYKELDYSVSVDDNIFKEITGKSNEVENDTNRFDNDNVSDSISQQLAQIQKIVPGVIEEILK